MVEELTKAHRQRLHQRVGGGPVEQGDLEAVDRRQPLFGAQHRVLAAQCARRQQADAHAVGHRALDPAQAGTGEADPPAAAERFDRVDDVVAVEPARRKGDQWHRVQADAAIAGTVDPDHGLGPAGHGGAAVAALLDQDQVQLTVVVAVGQVAAETAGDFQLHLGVFAVEGAEQLGRCGADEILRHPQPDSDRDRGPGQGFEQLVVERQQLARMTEHELARIGGMHVAVAAHQQRMASHFFQPADLLADGGLGRVQTRGGGGEAGAVGHHHHRAQQVQVEQGAIRFFTGSHAAIVKCNGSRRHRSRKIYASASCGAGLGAGSTVRCVRLRATRSPAWRSRSISAGGPSTSNSRSMASSQ